MTALNPEPKTLDATRVRTRWTRRRGAPVFVVASALMLTVVVLWAIAGGWLAPDDPAAQDLVAGPSGMSGAHWLGTDDLGRDVFSRLLLGTRNAILGPALVAVVTVVVGAILGMTAGLRGGWVDMVISRFADLVYALPALLMIVVIVGIVGGSSSVAWGVFIFFALPTEIRLTRSATLSQARLPYIDAARTLGLPTRWILLRHILPNILPTVVATGLLDFVGALVGLSSLSFLGLGVAPGTADWGLMMADGRSILDLNVWAAAAPAVMIILTAVSGTVFGDWLYDRLSIERGSM